MSTGGRRLPLVVSGLVLLPALVLALWPHGGPAPAGADDVAGIPERLAGYSYLTGDVSDSPPGRAVALFQHGWGVEFMDLPQAVVVGADADVYRRLDLAERRAGPENQGDPGPMLLSPDGGSVAVGEHDSGRPDLLVLDLGTGAVERHRVPGGRSLLPLAWSPDGSRLAYLLSETATSTLSGMPPEGDVGVLDLATGQARPVAGAERVWTAAFSPDGSELAVQHPDAAGGGLQLLDLAGDRPRDVELPDGHHLDGPDAWSPDGRLLATARAPYPCLDLVEETEALACHQAWESTPDVVGFVPAGTDDQQVPAPVGTTRQGRVLGWTSTREVVVLAAAEGPDHAGPDELWLAAVSVDDGTAHRLSTVTTDNGDYGVGRFQLATALLPDLEVRAAGDPDRGPWPTWVRVGLALLAAAAAGLATRALLRVGRVNQGA